MGNWVTGRDWVVLALFLVLAPREQAHAQQNQAPPPAFADLLKRASSAPSDSCEPSAEDFSDLEFRLFQAADLAVAERLNRASLAGSKSPEGAPRERAVEALETLARLSTEINRGWPDPKRFHYQVLDIPPVLVVMMTYRNRATVSFFAMPQRGSANQPPGPWQAIGVADDHRFKAAGGYDWFELFPLERGPSKKARFLAEFSFAGCGSGVGVAYYGYEWSPLDRGDLHQFLKLEGAASHIDSTDGHVTSSADRDDSSAPLGKLQTEGSVITLPYCWYSAGDTWNNPSLCAVNSYDLSGDRVRFVNSVSNRPDLLPIVKAIEYAQARDYPSVLSYCGSPEVAQQMVREVPASVSAASGLNIRPLGTLRKRVEIGDQPVLRFDVEKRGERWLVVAFRMD
ncbi:MAG TPA: hypothetical protein VGH38_09165 [Bryobacteraceae bacterium]|jgi:hypothetical protein